MDFSVNKNTIEIIKYLYMYNTAILVRKSLNIKNCMSI